MASKVEERTYDEALGWLRDHGFDLLEAPGTQGRVFLKKYSCSAAIQKNGGDGVKIGPNGEIVDSGVPYNSVGPAGRLDGPGLKGGRVRPGRWVPSAQRARWDLKAYKVSKDLKDCQGSKRFKVFRDQRVLAV